VIHNARGERISAASRVIRIADTDITSDAERKDFNHLERIGREGEHLRKMHRKQIKRYWLVRIKFKTRDNLRYRSSSFLLLVVAVAIVLYYIRIILYILVIFLRSQSRGRTIPRLIETRGAQNKRAYARLRRI
jgi:hypothetical protein